MDILLVLTAVFVTVLAVCAAVVGCVWAISLAVERVVKVAGQTATQTVSTSLKAVTGGMEQSEPIEDGIVREEQPPAPFYPAHELDDLMIPGSSDEAAMREAGWVRGPTQATPPQLPPQ